MSNLNNKLTEYYKNQVSFTKCTKRFLCGILAVMWSISILQLPASVYAANLTEADKTNTTTSSTSVSTSPENGFDVNLNETFDSNETNLNAIDPLSNTENETDDQPELTEIGETVKDGYKSIYPDESRRLYVFKVDGQKVHQQYVRNGQKIDFYRAPSKNDLIFVGWRLPDSEFTEETPEENKYLDFDKVITFNPKDPSEEKVIELEAVYKSHFAVTFHVPNDLSEDKDLANTNYIEYDSQEVGDGEKIDFDSVLIPSIRNMSFKHWSSSKGGEAFDVETKIDKSLDLYAVFTPAAVYYFNTDGGNAISPRIVNIDTIIPVDEIPVAVKKGYKFIEWREEGSNEAFDFNLPATEDHNLIAIYEPSDTTYNLVIHLEKKAEDKSERENSDYNTVYFAEKNGVTGEVPTFEENDPVMNDNEGEYKYIPSTPHTSTDAQGPYKLSEIFEINREKTKLEDPIKADGTSVYHVYLDYKTVNVYIGGEETKPVDMSLLNLIRTFDGKRLYQSFVKEFTQKAGLDPSVLEVIPQNQRNIRLDLAYNRPNRHKVVVYQPSLHKQVKRTESIDTYLDEYRNAVVKVYEDIFNAAPKQDRKLSLIFRGISNLTGEQQAALEKVYNEDPYIFTRIVADYMRNQPFLSLDAYKYFTSDGRRVESLYPITPTIPEANYVNGFTWKNFNTVLGDSNNVDADQEVSEDSFGIYIKNINTNGRARYSYWLLPESEDLDIERDRDEWIKILKKYIAKPFDEDLTQYGGVKLAEGDIPVPGSILNADKTDFIDIPNYEVLKELSLYPGYNNGTVNIKPTEDGIFYFNIFYIKKLYDLEFRSYLTAEEEQKYDIQTKKLAAKEIVNTNLPSKLVIDQTEKTVIKNGVTTKLVFRGWYDNAQFIGEPLTADGETVTMPSANKILYAKWTHPDVKLRIHKTPNLNSEVVEERTYHYGEFIEEELLYKLKNYENGYIPVIAGLNQTGWRERIRNRFISFDPKSPMLRDKDIYPVYDKNYVSVYVRENANAPKQLLTEVALASSYGMPRYVDALKVMGKEDMTGDKYYFDGWKIVAPSTYEPKDKVYQTYEKTSPLFFDITIEPLLSEIRPSKTHYVLHDNYDGGSEKIVDNVEHNERIDLSFYQPKRQGYVLVGWNTDKTYGKGTPYGINEKLLVDDNSSQTENHLYAMWAKVKLNKSVIKVTDAQGVERNPVEVKAQGDKIFYRLQVTNNGETPINYPTLTDDILKISDRELSQKDISAGTIKELAVGEVMNYDLSEPYIVNADDLAKTEIVNHASIKYETPYGPSVTVEDRSDAKVKVNAKPQIEVSKVVQKITDANGQEYPGKTEAFQLGDRIYYALQIRNSGLVPVTKLSISDELLAISDIDFSFSGSLQPNSTVTISLNKETLGKGNYNEFYSVTAEDIRQGVITNIASVVPSTPVIPGEKVVTPPVKVTITPKSEASFSKEIVKISNRQDEAYTETEKYVHNYGDKIYYSFTLTNTGNIAINSAKLEDDLLSLDIPLEEQETIKKQFPLPPLGSVTLIASVPYEVTQEDWNKSEIINHAQVSVKFADGSTDLLKGERSVPLKIEGEPSFSVAKKIEKITDSEGNLRNNQVESINDKVFYYFEVENTGNLDISSVTIEDKMLGINQSYKIKIPVGQTKTIKSDLEPKLVYSATVNDFNDSKLVNTATVKVRVPSGELPPQNPSVEVSLKVSPDFSLTKEVRSITNDKDEAYDDLSKIVNFGDKVYYQFTITNTGNLPMHKAAFTDSLLELDVELSEDIKALSSKFPLQPGDSITFNPEKPYTVTQAYWNKKLLENTAKVNARFSNNSQLERNAKKVIPIEITVTPDFKVTKFVDRVEDAAGNARQDSKVHQAGDKIFYGFVVENTGNIDISAVTIDDPMIGINKEKLELNIPVGQKITISQQVANPYIVKSEDFDSETVLNEAKVTVTVPPGELEPKVPSTTTQIAKNPEATVEKFVVKVTDKNGNEREQQIIEAVGDRVYYGFVITNTGNIRFKDFRLIDGLLDIDEVIAKTAEQITADGSEYLESGQSFRLERPTDFYVATEDDVTKSNLENVASIKVPFINVPQQPLIPSNKTNTPIKIADKRDIEVKKNIIRVVDAENSPYDDELPTFHANGDQVYYGVEIKNIGTTTIETLHIEDALLGVDVNINQSLAPGASYQYVIDKPLRITQEHLDRNLPIDNIVYVTPKFKTGVGNKIPSTKRVVPKVSPNIKLTKIVQKIEAKNNENRDDKVLAIGDKIFYKLKVENTGNISINAFNLSDDLLKFNQRFVKTLLPGENFELELSTPYIVQQSDIGLVEKINHASVEGEHPGGAENSRDKSSVKVPMEIEPHPNFELKKEVIEIQDASGKNYSDQEPVVHAIGDRIFYKLTIVNTGDISISEFNIVDRKLAINTDLDLDKPLLPGDTLTYELSKPYVVSVEDFALFTETGEVYNFIDNLARVTAGFEPPRPTDPNQPEVMIPDLPVESENRVPILKQVDFEVEKHITKVIGANGRERSNQQIEALGDRVYYSFKLTNTGNQPLAKVHFIDELLDLDIDQVFETPLLPGQSYDFAPEQSYTFTAKDMNLTEIENIVDTTVTTTDKTTPPAKQGKVKIKVQIPLLPVEPSSPDNTNPSFSTPDISNPEVSNPSSQPTNGSTVQTITTVITTNSTVSTVAETTGDQVSPEMTTTSSNNLPLTGESREYALAAMMLLMCMTVVIVRRKQIKHK